MYKLLLEEIIGKMRKSVSQGEGGMYLDQVYYISSDEGILNLGTSSKFFKEKLESLGFIKKIEDELSERNGSAIKVNIEIKKQDPSKPEQNIQKRDKGGDSPKNHPDLKEEFTFSNFVISTNNELAANAAMAIAKAPGKFYNPFLIYGGVGLGKTHLMHAIGNDIYRRFPEKKVVYVTAEKFTNEFIAVLGQKPKMAAFKNKYRGSGCAPYRRYPFLPGKGGCAGGAFQYIQRPVRGEPADCLYLRPSSFRAQEPDRAYEKPLYVGTQCRPEAS